MPKARSASASPARSKRKVPKSPAENRRIEAELTAEERTLTEIRDDLSPVQFRARAAAFDEKVQRLRREQDEKARALGQTDEEARARVC